MRDTINPPKSSRGVDSVESFNNCDTFKVQCRKVDYCTDSVSFNEVDDSVNGPVYEQDAVECHVEQDMTADDDSQGTDIATSRGKLSGSGSSEEQCRAVSNSSENHDFERSVTPD
jgi:hypothetical protein